MFHVVFSESNGENGPFKSDLTRIHSCTDHDKHPNICACFLYSNTHNITKKLQLSIVMTIKISAKRLNKLNYSNFERDILSIVYNIIKYRYDK